MRCGVFTTAAVALLLGTVAESSGGAFPGRNGKIVFVSPEGGKHKLFVIAATGGRPARLTRSEAFNPAWSADGKRLAFVRVSDEIFTINRDGTGLKALTVIGEFASGPSWSPDGTKIAYEDLLGSIGVIGADGTGDTAIVQDQGAGDTEKDQPAWSPRGTRIAFRDGTEGGSGSIFLMNPDGTGIARVTRAGENDSDPVWSPDGRRIAFVRAIECRVGSCEFAIHVVGIGGRKPRLLARNAQSPAWSPDGRKIAFVRGTPRRARHVSTDRNAEIYVMNADGTGQTRLTRNGKPEYDLDWQPLPR